MKRFVPLSLLLLTLLGSVNAIAQPAQHRPGGGGRDFEERREDRRAQRQEFRREQQERRAEPGQGQGGRGGQEGQDRREPERQRMSPEERRALRDQIRDHGREIYHPPHRR